MPKLRRQTFVTAIIERYKRCESPIEESLIEMYLAGVSVCRVGNITKILRATRVSYGTISNLNKKVYIFFFAHRRSLIREFVSSRK